MSVGNGILILKVKNIVEILRTLHFLGMSGSDYRDLVSHPRRMEFKVAIFCCYHIYFCF